MALRFGTEPAWSCDILKLTLALPPDLKSNPWAADPESG